MNLIISFSGLHEDSASTYPVMMALRSVALSSSDLKKMDEEKSRGRDVVNEDNSCKKIIVSRLLTKMMSIKTALIDE
jgi:hypothetical protein